VNGHLGSRAAAYVDGALPEAEASQAREHLAACGRCRAQVEEQIRVRDLLRGGDGATSQSAPLHPQDGFLAALAAMPSAGVPERRSAAVPPTHGRRELTQRVAVSGVVAGLALVGVAWSVGGVSGTETVAVTPDSLSVQHAATAGDLPFWGSSGDSTPQVAAAAKGSLPMSAVQRLREGAGALQTVSYRGVQQWLTDQDGSEQSAVAEISHIPGHGTATRLVADGQSAASFRPETASDAVSGRDALALLSSRYVVVPDGSATVAGRLADRVAAYSAAGDVAARFWIDRATGLPLASERYDASGHPESSHRFTTVAVDDAAVMPKHLPIATTATWVEAPGGTAPEAVQAEGWLCPGATIAGGLDAFDARLAEGTPAPVLHLVYTDGLRAVSVFEQRARLDPAQLSGFVVSSQNGRQVFHRDGVPSQATWAQGPFVITVLGDEAAISAVVESLAAEDPPRADDDDRIARVSSGLARVGSWFDPFG
jgi:sigma-E factor negative regulatory protein RseB